jgi:dihydroorotase-like cyclic amidohydrolase
MCSTSPARIFGLTDRGSLKSNAHADVTILDPQFEWTFDTTRSKSKSRNTPFHGRSMHGAAVATIVGGRLVYLHPDFGRITEMKQRVLLQNKIRRFEITPASV